MNNDKYELEYTLKAVPLKGEVTVTTRNHRETHTLRVDGKRQGEYVKSPTDEKGVTYMQRKGRKIVMGNGNLLAGVLLFALNEAKN
jgi:hypothetical protein